MSNPLSFANTAALSTAIQAFIEDTGSELTTNMNTLIQLGEARCYTDLNLETLDTVITANLTAATRPQAIKPADCLAVRSLHIRDVGGAGEYRKLARRTLEFCLEYAPNPATQAEPIYYAEYSPTELYLVPTPNAAYQASLHQVVKPPSLISGSATWLATTGGDLLLYACLISTEAFLKADDSFMQRWKGEYTELLNIRRFELRDLIRGDYSPMKNAARTAEEKA